MLLKNPLKLQRVVAVRKPPSDRDGPRDNNRRGPPRSSPAASAGGRPVVSIGKDRDGGGGPGDGAPPGGDRRPRRAAPVKPAANQWKKRGQTSLRIGTGKKGRSAAITGRRGSLRRRDRSAQKAAKESAAIRRKTVSLPE